MYNNWKCRFNLSVFCFVISFSSVYNQSFSSRMRINTLCKSPRGDVCVEIRDCPYFVDLLDNSRIPRPRHVIRSIRDRQCGFTGSTPKVCCESAPLPSPIPLIVAPSVASITAPVPTVVTNSHQPQKVLPSVPKIIRHRNQALLPQLKCGAFLPGFRIMSGIKTAIGEFPWMALIASSTEEDGLDFRCAATLINDRYVLTAAHCVTDISIVSVRLGEHNVNTEVDCDWRSVKCSDPVQDVKIEAVIVHPNYFAKNFANDIALIRLAKKINFTDFIQPICLPIGDLVNFDLDGKFAVITGWGVTESGFRSPELLKTLVPVVSNQQCASIYERYADISVERQLCAGGYRGRDSCGGDSGGPLKHVAPMPQETPASDIDSGDESVTITVPLVISRYVQFGVVSYGPRHCGVEGQPGVYTKVAYYMDWILDNLRI